MSDQIRIDEAKRLLAAGGFEIVQSGIANDEMVFVVRRVKRDFGPRNECVPRANRGTEIDSTLTTDFVAVAAAKETS